MTVQLVACLMRVRQIDRALTSLAALVLIAAPPSVAGARTQPLPLTSGSGYLALGDSVTFGYEEGGVTPKPNYHDASTFIAYPEQIGKELHVKVTNAACPGETSASLVDNAAQSNGCETCPAGSRGATGRRSRCTSATRARSSRSRSATCARTATFASCR